MKQITFIFRSLHKNYKLNIVNLFSMALGLVSASIILAYVYQEFHYDSANLNSEQIYRVEPSVYAPMAEVLETKFPEIEKATRVGFFYGYLACSSEENKLNETSAIFADPDFFDLFSFPIVKGKKSKCLIEPNSIAISESAAYKYFGIDDPIGKILKIGDGAEFIVTSVFKDFQDNSNFLGNLVLPLKQISKLTQIWVEPSWDSGSEIHTFVLMNDKSDVQALSKKSLAVFSKYTSEINQDLVFQPLKDIHINKQIVWEARAQIELSYLYILLAIAILILGVSSANFLFLFIGIKIQRKVNTGIKKVFGASRTIMIKENFAEVAIQMLLSIGLSLIFYFIFQFVREQYFAFIPSLSYFDNRLGLILLVVIFLVVFLTGLYPSLILSSQKPVHIFSSQKQKSFGSANLVNKLVIAQFSICMLIILTSLFINKQVIFMEKQNPGYARDELITIPLNMHIGDGINSDKFDAFSNELKKYPEIKEATMAFLTPASNSTPRATPEWEGQQEGEEVEMNWTSVSYDYFRTLNVQVLYGRSFSPKFPMDVVDWDTHTGAFMLNKSAVEAMGLKDPIGKQFKVWGFKGKIIGVVDNYNSQSMRSAISPMFFWYNPFFLNEIIVRVDPQAPLLSSIIKKVWNQFVPEYPMDYHFVRDQIKALYKPEQSLADILTVFSILAIFISSMGLFALTILSLNQRIKEIGIRKVNGAKNNEVITLLNKEIMKRIIVAFIIATPVVFFAMNKWLENFAYKTSLSWWIFVLVGLLVLLIALLTVSWQSWQAASRNPIEALRNE